MNAADHVAAIFTDRTRDGMITDTTTRMPDRRWRGIRQKMLAERILDTKRAEETLNASGDDFERDATSWEGLRGAKHEHVPAHPHHEAADHGALHDADRSR